MAYTAFDRFVAWCRFRAAARHVGTGSLVCDIGSGEGAPFLRHLRGRAGGVALDEYPGRAPAPGVWTLKADITRTLPLHPDRFDHVTMLAVLEHLEAPRGVLEEAHRVLRPGGTLIMTWPSSAVDPLLEVLTRVGLVHAELGFDQHQPRIPRRRLRAMLEDIGFAPIVMGTFELGLNNWLVAHKSHSRP
jgi:SAM-dependent methyltransferase